MLQDFDGSLLPHNREVQKKKERYQHVHDGHVWLLNLFSIVATRTCQ